MSEQPTPGIYLMVDFSWPRPFQPEYRQNARNLHQIVQDQGWIREVMAASGGVGAGASSVWIFWLENYAALDRLLRNQEDPVAQAYLSFIKDIQDVSEKVRHEIIFL